MPGPMQDWSESSLMSVKDMIDLAFGEVEGDSDNCTCDFRILHALLLVLARTLAVLDRSVPIELTPDISTESSMIITEVKVKAKGGKGKKGKGKQTAPTKEAPETDKKTRKSVQTDKPPDRAQKGEQTQATGKSKDTREAPYDKDATKSGKDSTKKEAADKKSDKVSRDETTAGKKSDRQRTADTDRDDKRDKGKLSEKGKKIQSDKYEDSSPPRKGKISPDDEEPSKKSKRSPDDQYDDSSAARRDKKDPDAKFEKGRGKKTPESKYEDEDSTPSKRSKRRPDDEYDKTTPSRKSKRSPDDEYDESTPSRKSKRTPDDEYDDSTRSRKTKRSPDDEYDESTPDRKSKRSRDEEDEEGSTSPTRRRKRYKDDEDEEGDASPTRKSKRAAEDFDEDEEVGVPKKGKKRSDGKYEDEDYEPSSKSRKSPKDKYDEDYSSTPKKGKRTPEDDQYDEDYSTGSKKRRKPRDKDDEEYSSRSRASSEESYDKTSKSSKASSRRPGEKGGAGATGGPGGQKGKKGKADLKDLLESPDSSDAEHERILIVEKLPAGEKGVRRKKSWSSASEQDADRAPQSLVGRPQFVKAINAVIKLQEQFGPIDIPGFKENMQLLEALHKGVPITDPIAALQLSARLEVVEKSIDKMMKVIQDLGKAKPKFVASVATSESKDGKYAPKSIVGSEKSEKSGKVPTDQQSVSSKKGQATPKGKGKETPAAAADTVSLLSSALFVTPADGASESGSEETKKKTGNATHGDMQKSVDELEAELKKVIVQTGHRTQLIAEKLLKRSKGLDQKLETKGDSDQKMDDLELAINQYSEKINLMDANFSTIMTDVQEELALMQHNLEITLDNMAESLANRETDADAVADLTNRFNVLQLDLDRTLYLQKDLNQTQNTLRFDLKGLWRDLAVLRDVKSDRDEVTEALSTKAGIALLNGLVSLTQFDAVIGDYQKRLAGLFDKFNHQEIIWQKGIDDVMRELNEKAEIFQVQALTDNVKKHMIDLREKIDFMTNICGEPRKSSDEKATIHELPCISCSTPARGVIFETEILGPRPPTLGGDKDECKSLLEKLEEKDKVAEEEIKTEDGGGDKIRQVCYKYQPIPHPIDRRAGVCSKICGGRPPKLSVDESEGISSSITVQAIDKEKGLIPKKLKTKKQVPCIPCNQQRIEDTISVNQPLPMFSFVNKLNESNLDVQDESDENVMEPDDMKVEDVSDEDFVGGANEQEVEED